MNEQYDPKIPPPSPWDSSRQPEISPLGGPLEQSPLNYALWGDRFLAALIDVGIALAAMVVLYVILFVLSHLVGGLVTQISPEIGSLLFCSGCLLWFVLPPLSYFLIGIYNKTFLLSSRGYSIGQGVMKLKVVDQNGNLVSTGTAFLRLICTVALSLVPVFGSVLDLLFPLWDPQLQTLHDKAVGTFVIKVK